MELRRRAALTNFQELELNASASPTTKFKIQNLRFKILKKLLPGVKENVLLENYTTFRIGGPADFFYEARTEKDLIRAIKAARQSVTPFLVLGKGSNLLFSDKGFRGLVIRNLASDLEIIKRFKKTVENRAGKTSDAHYLPADPKKYLQFSDLDYPPEPFDTEVEAASGVPLQRLIQWSLKNNLTGLQWFAGIPGSLGGAVVYNVHGGTKLFSDYVKAVVVLDENDRIKKIKNQRKNLQFAYDASRFQNRQEIILRVVLNLSRGDIKRARFVYREWFRRKLKVQSQALGAGSIFKNFSLEEIKKVGAPTGSAGWFIDQCGFKGKVAGGVKVSEIHANFIVNFNHGRASDVKKLIKTIKKTVKKKFKLNLREEILILPEKF
jgi:UDP-N-acetylmuramate dehydrogenase